ncbi:MAG: hypothetical protein QNJ23_10510 [Woeseiaceae bacterium]|nr:hypothetical protein [Woeseiaceae bacterium]
MRTTLSITTILAVMAAFFAGTVIAEDHGPLPTYVVVDCMKSSSADYVALEQEIWQPVHQHLVDSGKRDSWALYEVVFGDRSRCDYYTVATYSGEDQLNGYADYAAAFAAVHTGSDMGKLTNMTLAARTLVASELWVLVDQTQIQEHRFAVVNKMFAADPVAYERMESEVFKAGHQVLIDGGDRAGWAVYALVSPVGSSIPYNYGTVDFVNDLGPVPMAEAMLAGNPDRDLDAMHDLLALRDHVLSETWGLLAATDPRTESD